MSEFQHFQERILSQLESMEKHANERHRDALAAFNKLNTLVTGGEHPESGIIVQLDRLKQAQSTRDKWTFGIGVTAAIALMKSIGAWISTHIGGA